MLGRRLKVLNAGPGSAEAVAAKMTEMMKDFMMICLTTIVINRIDDV
jgi:hypothetical protein